MLAVLIVPLVVMDNHLGSYYSSPTAVSQVRFEKPSYFGKSSFLAYDKDDRPLVSFGELGPPISKVWLRGTSFYFVSDFKQVSGIYGGASHFGFDLTRVSLKLPDIDPRFQPDDLPYSDLDRVVKWFERDLVSDSLPQTYVQWRDRLAIKLNAIASQFTEMSISSTQRDAMIRDLALEFCDHANKILLGYPGLVRYDGRLDGLPPQARRLIIRCRDNPNSVTKYDRMLANRYLMASSEKRQYAPESEPSYNIFPSGRFIPKGEICLSEMRPGMGTNQEFWFTDISSEVLNVIRKMGRPPLNPGWALYHNNDYFFFSEDGKFLCSTFPR